MNKVIWGMASHWFEVIELYIFLDNSNRCAKQEAYRKGTKLSKMGLQLCPLQMTYLAIKEQSIINNREF